MFGEAEHKRVIFNGSKNVIDLTGVNKTDHSTYETPLFQKCAEGKWRVSPLESA